MERMPSRARPQGPSLRSRKRPATARLAPRALQRSNGPLALRLQARLSEAWLSSKAPQGAAGPLAPRPRELRRRLAEAALRSRERAPSSRFPRDTEGGRTSMRSTCRPPARGGSPQQSLGAAPRLWLCAPPWPPTLSSRARPVEADRRDPAFLGERRPKRDAWEARLQVERPLRRAERQPVSPDQAARAPRRRSWWRQRPARAAR